MFITGVKIDHKITRDDSGSARLASAVWHSVARLRSRLLIRCCEPAGVVLKLNPSSAMAAIECFGSQAVSGCRETDEAERIVGGVSKPPLPPQLSFRLSYAKPSRSMHLAAKG